MRVNRTRSLRAARAMWIVIGALVVALVAGCGSSDDETQPTSAASPAGTAVSSSPEPLVPSSTSAPEATVTRLPPGTPSPAVTATPEATTSPAPTAVPTPVELTFDQPDSWDGTMTPPSTGPLGIVYAQSNIAYYVAKPNRLHAWAAVNVGVNERPTASVWLFNTFTAPGQGSTPVTARISTSASWKGALSGAGAAGTGARATITLSVLEDGKALATKPVHALEHRNSALTVGGFRDTGSKDVELEVALVAGHEYELRLTAKCEAFSGAIGVATSCVYGAKTTIDDGYVDWGPRTIVFAP